MPPHTQPQIRSILHRRFGVMLSVDLTCSMILQSCCKIVIISGSTKDRENKVCRKFLEIVSILFFHWTQRNRYSKVYDSDDRAMHCTSV